MNINERIRYFRKDVLKMNQRQFAASLGMAQTGVSGTERDGATVTDRFIKSICFAYNLSEVWLRDGIEPMYIQPPTFSLDKFIEERGGTDLEVEIVKTYFELDPEIRKAILSHFKEKFTPSSYGSLYDSVPDTAEELEAQFQLVTDHDKEVG
ncbi:helix-turn-helix transcriptional regulator [Hungatella sp. L12]|uniref:Helix-turn-helix transcriptional regulator n=1 Tax=Hungatella hominis TaxID=2763050 RepID=A0ABR7H200_9FIRM|nr:helix-turn-helix transcriptional regulator [Hungatella hominis]MBC5707171.1 helix-turn-helix transcriptional regulator [Hungatella hominis]